MSMIGDPMIGEILAGGPSGDGYDSALTNEQILNLTGYLMAKYGL